MQGCDCWSHPATQRAPSEPAAIVVHQDISFLKETEALKDMFIGLFAHELRTPIAVLTGFAQTLLAHSERGNDTQLSAWQREALQGIDHAALQLAKLSEAVEKLRAAAAVAPAAPVPSAAAPVAAKDATGSIAPAPTPADAPKVELARLPTVEGWVLRGVSNGVALIEGRRGIYEVYAGDPVPGAGRVDAIRRQDGRWVVVTSKGLIVGR